MSAARPESISSDPVAGHAVGQGSLLRLLQQIAVAGRQLKRVLTRFLDDCDLNDTELLLLWVCHGAGVEGIAQNRLADSVGLSPAQVSGLVERMGRRNLIERYSGSADRRRRLWKISSTGRQTLGEVLARLAPADSACEMHVEPAGAHDLVRLLARFGEAAAQVADGTRVTQKLRVFPVGDAAAAGPLKEPEEEKP